MAKQVTTLDAAVAKIVDAQIAEQKRIGNDGGDSLNVSARRVHAENFVKSCAALGLIVLTDWPR